VIAKKSTVARGPAPLHSEQTRKSRDTWLPVHIRIHHKLARYETISTPPTMSYGKKDEDADLGLVKVDRTQVFQEGEHQFSAPQLGVYCPLTYWCQWNSPTLQQLSDPAAKMPDSPHQDCAPPVYGRKVPDERGDNPLLWNFEAVPE